MTTLELLAVLALVALMTVMAGPEIRRALTRASVEAAADGTVARIRQARLLALKSRTPHRVSLVDRNGQWWVELEREQGGAFVAVPGQSSTIDPTIDVLSVSTLSRVGVSARGVCDAGRIHLGSDSQPVQRAIAVDRSCAIRRY